MTLRATNVTFYFDDGQIRIPTEDAMAYLRQFDSFSVLLKFNHPVTNILIKQEAVCSPDIQVATESLGNHSECFITEVSGVTIRLPSDISCYSSELIESKRFTSSATFRDRGEIKTRDLRVEYMKSIIIAGRLRDVKTAI